MTGSPSAALAAVAQASASPSGGSAPGIYASGAPLRRSGGVPVINTNRLVPVATTPTLGNRPSASQEFAFNDATPPVVGARSGQASGASAGGGSSAHAPFSDVPSPSGTILGGGGGGSSGGGQTATCPPAGGTIAGPNGATITCPTSSTSTGGTASTTTGGTTSTTSTSGGDTTTTSSSTTSTSGGDTTTTSTSTSTSGGDTSTGDPSSSGGTSTTSTSSGGVIPGVPEPASWSMMIAGYLALGAALRRRARPSSAKSRSSLVA